MPKSANQKARILELYRLFTEKTDSENGITLKEIISAYKNRLDIETERKSVYDDIQSLQDFGMDIIAEKNGSRYEYRLASRDFELSEVKLLVDAVQASKFITEKKSKKLIEKLSKLASEREAKNLVRGVYISDRVKSENETTFYAVDSIHRALQTNKKITFKYYSWDKNKKKVMKHDGKIYCVSPCGLMWFDDNYYLLAYDSDIKGIKHFRVDKTVNLEVSEDDRDSSFEYRKMNMEMYSKKMFGMYNGTEETVTLRATNNLANSVIDRFGKNVFMHPNDDGETFDFSVTVSVSVRFFAWVMGFAPNMTIIKPENVREDMIKKLNEELKAFGKENANAD